MSTTMPDNPKSTDTVRVLRVLEYTGPRDKVEQTLERSIQGSVTHGGITIRAATIGLYPEILEFLDSDD